MSWSDSRTISLDAAAASGIYQPPVTLRAYNAPRPSIRTVTVINQSPNVNVGICIQQAKLAPDFLVGANYMAVIPIVGTDQIVFVFSLPAGGKQSGQVYLGVTEDALAASSSVAPSAGVSSAFVLDVSALDDGNTRLQ